MAGRRGENARKGQMGRARFFRIGRQKKLEGPEKARKGERLEGCKRVSSGHRVGLIKFE